MKRRDLPTLMQEPELRINIFPYIAADALANACHGFPPASIAKDDFMSGLTKDTSGREVVVTFKRKTFQKHKAKWQAWVIHEAHYTDEK
jgi:hypothetical protein